MSDVGGDTYWWDAGEDAYDRVIDLSQFDTGALVNGTFFAGSAILLALGKLSYISYINLP